MKTWLSGRSAALFGGLLLFAVLMAVGIRDEVPLGSLSGAAFMSENSAALANATVVIRPKFTIPDWQAAGKTIRTTGAGNFRFLNIPAGAYTIEAYSKQHSMKETAISVEEGKSLSVNLELKPNEPYLKLNAGQHVFAPEESPEFNVEGFGPDDKISMHVFSVNVAAVKQKGGLQRVLSAAHDWNTGINLSNANIFVPLNIVDHAIRRRDAEGAFSDTVQLMPLPKGTYWIDSRSSSRRSGTWLQVSDIAIIAKKAAGKMLCYVTDIRTGEPIPGASITLYQGAKAWQCGISDNQGLDEFDYASVLEDGSAVLAAERGDSSAFIAFDKYEDDSGAKQLRTHIYTERPVYRPGQDVYYKGVVRQLVGADYQIPASATAQIEIRDPDDNVLEKRSVATSQMGTFSGSFSLNSEALTGAYAIVCTIGDSKETKYVQIASYRKPEYTVAVKGEQPYYVRGDQARVVVKSQYYFGGPVMGAKVSAQVYRAPEWNRYWPEDDPSEVEASDEGYSDAGEYVKNVEAVTDEHGEAVIEFDTDFKDADSDSDYVYTVNASVEDAGGKYYNGEGKVKVTRGEFSLNVDTSDYIVSPGDSATMTAIAANNGTSKPVKDAIVRFDYGYETWTGNKVVMARVGTETVRTGADGKAAFHLLAQRPGSMQIVATAKDSRGNAIRSTQYLYVTDVGSYDYGPRSGSVQVVLDKRQYKVGDTAKALVIANGVDSSALLTVEADGVLKRSIVRVKNGSGTINLPVTQACAPNCYVSVAMISKKKFYEGTKRLSVDLSQRKLNIAITSDKPTYEPRQTAIYTIKTTDSQGRPVAAEISFGVVDESIYAIREDNQDIIKAFYPRRWKNVETLYSFPEIYLGDGDKDAAHSEVREKFLDTAFWAAGDMTNADGIAVVRVSLPDNLTTWRATATGVTGDTLVGRATQKMVVQKKLMLRLQTPRFLTQKDSSTVTVVVHNNTGKSQHVKVRLEAKGAAIEGSAEQSVSVGDKPESVQWKVSTPTPGEATFTASASGGGLSDAMRTTIPVKPYGLQLVENRTGDTKSQPQFRVTVHRGYVSGTGSLRLSLGPTISATLLNSVDYLIGYPYGCTEQTMSRFMPTVVVASTLKALGMARPDLEAKIPDMLAKGYARLRLYQHGDGGWGWWEYDDTEAWMTAYVLEGYARAAAAGYPPNQQSLDRAIEWSKGHLNDVAKKSGFALPDAEDLRLVAALALNGSGQFASNFAAAVDLKRVYTPKQLIPLLGLYHSLGRPFDEHKKIALQRLAQMAEAGSSRASWKEDWYGVETTAQAALAIATVDPKNPVLPRAVRWLVMQQRGDHWFSTRDTAYALLALSQYIKASGEGRPNFSLQILVNGAAAATIQATPAHMTLEGLKVNVPFSLLRAGDNVVSFRLSGAGNCYYSAELKQVVDRGSLAQSLTGEDLRVDRRYYRLEARRLEDGTLRLLPSTRPIDSIQAGELIRCVLTIQSGRAREFMMLEDPLPSGCEVSDREDPADGWDWENWWSRTDIRDDRILFFARRLAAGASKLEYTMRAEAPGRVRALPATLSNMYDPDVRASSGETPLAVTK